MREMNIEINQQDADERESETVAVVDITGRSSKPSNQANIKIIEQADTYNSSRLQKVCLASSLLYSLSGFSTFPFITMARLVCRDEGLLFS